MSREDLFSDDEIESLNNKVYEQVLNEKKRDSSKFASYWMEDEQNIQAWTKEEIDSDLNKKFIQACTDGDVDVVKKMLTESSDPIELINSKDDDGYTSLHRAAGEDNVEISKILLMQGANVGARTNDGWTPLHCAAFWNNVEVANILLYQYNADVNAQTDGGLTPLHLASSQPTNRETMILLLTYPFIDIKVHSKINETARDIALRKSRYADLFMMTADYMNAD